MPQGVRVRAVLVLLVVVGGEVTVGLANSLEDRSEPHKVLQR